MKTDILGIKVTNASASDVLEFVADSVKSKKPKLTIVTPNPEMVMYARSHPQFQKIINEADISLCDGIGLFIAGRILRRPVQERISGVDFMLGLCRDASEKAMTVGFLGGRPGIAERTAECLRENLPRLEVAFTGAEFEANQFPTTGLDILFVAYGVPKQEEWIQTNLPTLPIRIAMGVGGAFDYISGDVSRAPFVIRLLGFEWLYRLIRQPWRWRRQVALIEFVLLVCKEKLRT
ncbi:MAG TPA: WecB/TagA/CpsF family glycosyltransferase [Patescibacteria group bacterium]|nr:WecB/TagA/CpsF family glycosyltransferase [Patescibacteria group bacterium]